MFFFLMEYFTTLLTKFNKRIQHIISIKEENKVWGPSTLLATNNNNNNKVCQYQQRLGRLVGNT